MSVLEGPAAEAPPAKVPMVRRAVATRLKRFMIASLVLDTEGSKQHVGTSKRRSRIKGYEPSALVRGGVDMKGIFYRSESTLWRAPSDQEEIAIASPVWPLRRTEP